MDRDDLTTQLLDLLALPTPSGYCRQGRPLLLQSRTNANLRRVAAMSCGNWGCRICGARLAVTAGCHYGGKILATDGPLFAAASPAPWSAVRRCLSRAAASWVRVRTGDGSATIIGNYPVMPGTAVEAHQAVQTLGAAIRAITKPAHTGARFRPLSSSRDWRLPPRHPPQWRVIGAVKNLAAVLAILLHHRLPFRHQPAPHALWSVSWAVPPSWSEAQITDLEREIAPYRAQH